MGFVEPTLYVGDQCMLCLLSCVIEALIDYPITHTPPPQKRIMHFPMTNLQILLPVCGGNKDNQVGVRLSVGQTNEKNK